MPTTMPEIRRAIQFTKSPFSKAAIYPAAYYQGKVMGVWVAKRSPFQRWLLGLACYNAGCGNILKAQAYCDNALLWKIIQHCLHLVTGKKANETKTYVSRVQKWWTEMVGQDPQYLPFELSLWTQNRLITRIQKNYSVRRYFSGRAWGTYWQLWGGWVTADHVHIANLAAVPDYIHGAPCRADGVIDAVVYGGHLPSRPPRTPLDGERVYVMGYPGGSDQPSLRSGRILIQRSQSGSDAYSQPTWILVIDNPPQTTRMKYLFANTEPVIGGMSGGIVVAKNLEPLGVLNTQNARADLNGDRVLDDSADFTALDDLWRVFKNKCGDR